MDLACQVLSSEEKHTDTYRFWLSQGWKEVTAGCYKVARIIDEGMKESFPIAESSKHYT